MLKSPSLFRTVCCLCLVPFERFASCSPGGWLLVLSSPSPFRAVCSLFLKLSTLVGAVRSWCFLKFSNPFRAVRTLFSNSLVSFERLAPQVLYFVWSGLLPGPCSQMLQSSSFFRAFRSVFLKNLLVYFERFAPCSKNP